MSDGDPIGLLDLESIEVLDVGGPTLQLLCVDAGTAIMRGVIGPRMFVPLHSHADPETFAVLEGEMEAFADDRWETVPTGGVFRVADGVRHAWRNSSASPAVALVTTTENLARFFTEIARPLAPGESPAWPPPPELIERLLQASARYGFDNAPPQDNAAIGLPV